MARRRIDDDGAAGLLETLTGGLSSVFSDTALLFNDRAAFVAGDGSDSPLAQAVREATRFQCRQYARNPGAFSTGALPVLADVCTPYLEGIGEDPTPAAAAPPLITGGQCDGIRYQVQAIGANTLNGGSFNLNRGNFTGPITSGPARNFNPPPCNPPNFLSNIEFRDRGGSLVIDQKGCAPFPQNIRLVCTPLAAEPGGGCGDDGPQFDEPVARPGLPSLPPSITVGLPGVGPVSVTIGLNPSGSLTVGLPSLGVEGTVNIGGGGDDDGGGGGGGDGAPPGDVGEPGTPGETGPGGETAGEAPSGSVLVGLRVDFAAPPVGANEYAPGVFRAVCYVYMGTSEGLDHDPAGAMMRDGQFVYAEKDNLTAWSVSANQGYNLRVTPYYRQAPTED